LKAVRIIVILISFIALGYFGMKSYKYAKLYEESTTTIANQCDANGLAQGKLDTFTSVISFGYIKDKTKEKLDILKTEQSRNQMLSNINLYYFMVILIFVILISFTCTPRVGTMTLAMGSLISLTFGLISPILMVSIHKEIEHLGDVILSFESKGILGSIQKLFENGEIVVAVTILLFSIIVPLLKIVTLIFTILFRNYRFSHHLVEFFRHIGKWSMIDVFVVATFLVYLTSNKGTSSHAEIEVGLYFFLAYVILSMITTIKLKRVMREKFGIRTYY
jgi:hypothetical protein